jgi:hypothetical protein
MEFYKIKDHKDLIKSKESKAVLSIDKSGLDKYREEREKLARMATIVEDNRRLEQEVTEIKQQLGEILSLLRNKN